MRQEIADRVLHETYVVEGGDIYSAQLLYPLSEADFIHLRNQHGWASRLADVFLGSVIASGVVVAAKILDALVTSEPPKTLAEAMKTAERSELWALVISLLLFLITLAISKFIPTKGSRVISNIETHFEKK